MSRPSTPHSELRTPRFLPHWGWLLLVTVLLIVAAVGLSIWLPYHREQALIEKINRWGGATIVEPAGPKWLRKRLGDERMKNFVHITQAQMNRSHVTDADMADFISLPSINLLNLTRTTIGDPGLAPLHGLKSLTHLWLGHTRVTDAGIVHIENLTSLSDLSLEATAVSDASIPRLSRLTNLKWLNLYRTDVSESGLEHLRKALPGCKIEL